MEQNVSKSIMKLNARRMNYRRLRFRSEGRNRKKSEGCVCVVGGSELEVDEAKIPYLSLSQN